MSFSTLHFVPVSSSSSCFSRDEVTSIPRLTCGCQPALSTGCCIPQGQDPCSKDSWSQIGCEKPLKCSSASSSEISNLCCSKSTQVQNGVLVCTDSHKVPGKTIQGPFRMTRKLNLKTDFFAQSAKQFEMDPTCSKYDSNQVFHDKNGDMVLQVGPNLHAGRVMSHDKFGLEFPVSIIEVQLPKCNYLFPAVWMTAPVGSHGDWAELDLLETTDTLPVGTFNIVTHQPSGTTQSTMFDHWVESQMFVGQPDCHARTWPFVRIVTFRNQDSVVVFVNPHLTFSADGQTLLSIEATPSVNGVNTYKEYNLNALPGHVDKNQAKIPMHFVFNIAIGGYGGVTKCGKPFDAASCNQSPCTNNEGVQLRVRSIHMFQ